MGLPAQAVSISVEEHLAFEEQSPIKHEYVEVLSPSTQRTDKVEKFNTYQQIPGLLEYVTVAQDEMKVEIYRHRKAGNAWQGEVFTAPTEQITVDSIGLNVTIADIYRRVTFLAPSEGEDSL